MNVWLNLLLICLLAMMVYSAPGNNNNNKGGKNSKHSTQSQSNSNSNSNSNHDSSSSEEVEDEKERECLKINKKTERQKCLVDRIYQSILHPEAYDITVGNKQPPAFDDNIHGRITPLGTFDDLQSSIEYFYGVSTARAIITNNPNSNGGQKNYSMIFIASDGDLVGVRVDLTSFRDVNVTQTGFFRFNSQGTKVISYDLALLRAGETYDPTMVYPDAYYFICLMEQNYCLNDLDEYPTFNDCYNYVSNEITIGSWDEASYNNLICRYLHAILVILRPEIHCNHIGKNSEKCIDRPLSYWYELQF